jgi:hypothetical protein
MGGAIGFPLRPVERQANVLWDMSLRRCWRAIMSPVVLFIHCDNLEVQPAYRCIYEFAYCMA